MTLRPIKAKHSSILRARRARLSNGRGHWGDFKPRFSLPRPNGKFNPFWATRKGKALVLILLSLSIVFGADQLLKNPKTGTSPLGDPIKPIWYNSQYTFAPLWRFQGSWLTLGFCVGCPNGLLAQPLTSATSTAINQNPMDLSTAVSHVLEFWQQYKWTIATGFPGANSYSSFGFFLTRNSTAPSQLNLYDPRADPNVVLFEKVNATGSSSTQAALYHVYIQTDPLASISSQDPGTFNTNDCKSGSQFMCVTTGYNTVLTNLQALTLDLNYTASNTQTSKSQDGIDITGGGVVLDSNTRLPSLNLQGSRYYWGLWVDANVGNTFGQNIVDFTVSPEPPNLNTCGFCGPGLSGNSMLVDIYIPPTANPYLDTGGFFGPIIKALISLGVFMLNAALQFVAFIAPGLQTGFSFMVGFYRTLFDLLGNLIWPNSNLGTAIFNELANFVSWMVDNNNGLLAAFGNSTAIFGRFVDALKVTFPWLPTALAIALNLLTLAVNSVGEVITLVSLAMTLIVGGFAFYVIFFYFVYVGDDALGGVLGWMETMQWLIFNIGLAWTARISNYGIDIITAVIGIIPKPFVQMVAHQIPRIPIIETNARFVAPSFDFGEARAGNIFSFALWSIGLDFLAWYESRNPALPGSIGALIPNSVTPLLALNGMLPFLNLIVVISWGACIGWMGTRALALAGLDITSDMPLSVGPGRKISSGPKGFKISKHTKRFQGKLEKQGKHFQGRLARKVGERVSEAEKEKKITEAFREAARKNQEQVEVKKARTTGERIAKEELARRQKAEPGAE